MASNPPAACCTTGFEQEGTPTGKLIKIAGTIDAYLATPPPSHTSHQHSPKLVLLFLSDVLGLWQNNKLQADKFAAAGFTTLMPDLYNGDPYPIAKPSDFATMLPTDATVVKWAIEGSNGHNPHTPAQIDPIMRASIAYIRSEMAPGANTRIVAVGYCVGAKYLVRHMNGSGTITAGFVAHPSYVEEDELMAAEGPFSIAAAETDLIFPVQKRYRTEELLREKGGVWSIALYSGVAHGFAIRGDYNDERNRWAEEEAFGQAVRFFEKWAKA